MATKWKNSKWTGILIIFLCAALGSAALCNAYPYLRERAAENREKYVQAAVEEDLAQSGTASVTTEPLESGDWAVDEDDYRYLLSSIYYLNYEMTPDTDAYEYFTQNYDTAGLGAQEEQDIMAAAAQLMQSMYDQYIMGIQMDGYAAYAVTTDEGFGTDSLLRNAITGEGSSAESAYPSGLVISYDGRGIPSVRKSWGITYGEEELLDYLKGASMQRLLADNGLSDGVWSEELTEEAPEAEETPETEEMPETEEGAEAEGAAAEAVTVMAEMEGAGLERFRNMPIPSIRNTSFAFGIRDAKVQASRTYSNDDWFRRQAYMQSGYVVCVLLLAFFMAALALALQNVRPLALRGRRVFCLPTELTAAIWICLIFPSGYAAFSSDVPVYTLGSGITEELIDLGVPEGKIAAGAATFQIWLFWTAMALCWYWMAAVLLPYLTHPIRTIRQHALTFDICRWIKKTWLKLWHWATDIELNEKLTRNIWKAVALNGVIVALLCSIWFGGVVGAILYSLILYVLIKKKAAEIQTDYGKLLKVTRSLAEGDLDVTADEDMGLFNDLRDKFGAIRSGFKKAVNDEVRSRNMKTELITNVSHDLKTPLTAIITYVDLLKKEDLTDEERREYVDTLDRKSQRLKVLIEDLFEVSKAATDNLPMNYDEVDLVNLIKQVKLENEDKIRESTLDIRWSLPETRCVLTLDPNRTYRVIDNLLQNILKYSMPHSRVYIALTAADNEVIITMKNMSAEEMNFSPEEIAERFVRGDQSRNTEGSGLGLAIARSFTELQGGSFRIEIDGDLFKVILKWKHNSQSQESVPL